MFSTLVSFLVIALLLVVMALMAYRRLYREFPFFFAYLAVVLATDIVRRIFLGKPYIEYFYVYWITEAVEVALGFLVLYEVLLIRMFPTFNVTVIYRWLFPLVGVAVTMMTVGMFLAAPSKGPSKLAVLVGEFTLALNFCQVAFLTFFCGLMLWMSREWRRHEVGIAGGFGIHGAVKLWVASERASHAYTSTRIDQLPTISYLIAIVIWLFYLSRTDPEPEEFKITQEMLDEGDKAYDAILHLLWKDPRKR